MNEFAQVGLGAVQEEDPYQACHADIGGKRV